MSAFTTSYNVAPRVGDNNSGSAVPTGTIFTYAGATSPAGWLFCNGAGVSRSQYADLFKLIGSIYGNGDGSTTFNVPDTSSRTIRGRGLTTFTTLGGTGGADTVMLTANNIAPHSHTLWRGGAQANQGSTNTDVIGTPNVDTGLATGGALFGPNDTPTSGSRTALTQTAVTTLNSFITLNYIIKT